MSLLKSIVTLATTPISCVGELGTELIAEYPTWQE